LTPFEAYKTYVSLKNHFTKESYDYFKYGGKGKFSESSFEVRKDKYFFYKLSKQKDLVNYIVSNFVVNENLWVGDLVNEEQSNSHYMQWLKKQQSLTYIISNEIELLDDNLNQNILVTDGQHPPLLRMFKQGKISAETLIALDDVLNIFKHWNKNIEEDIIWPKMYLKLMKYKPFIKYDTAKIKELLKKRFLT